MPNNRAGRNPAWQDRASGISRECTLPCSFYSVRSIARNENRGTPVCRAWKRWEEAEWGKGGLIEILIAGICRSRAQHPYVNRKRRFVFSFNDARINIMEIVATTILIYTRR